MSDKQRKYATANHPTIEALVHGLYRYKDRAQAVARLKHIATHFVLSKEQPDAKPDEPAALMWIKGFGVTEAEAEQGYTGHFAQVGIVTLPNGMFSLMAVKIERPINTHPQKKRLASKHPNWGHPVMRAVKKQKVYKTLEAANSELELLHTEFPEVSIPGQGKLYIIIYEKREGIARPTHKIALELKTHPEGGFVITWRDNEKQPKRSLAQPEAELADAPDADEKTDGQFAANEALRKLKRRKRPAAATAPVAEGTPGKFAAAVAARKKRK